MQSFDDALYVNRKNSQSQGMQKESYIGTGCCLSQSFILISYIYRKIYLHTNNTANTYINGVIFFDFPQTRLITT